MWFLQNDGRRRKDTSLNMQGLPTPGLLDPYGRSVYQSSSSNMGPPIDYEIEEINRLVREFEDKLISLKHSAHQSTLDMVFSSRVFQTVTQLGDGVRQLNREQKQALLTDLRKLLSEILPGSSNSTVPADTRESQYGGYPVPPAVQRDSYGRPVEKTR